MAWRAAKSLLTLHRQLKPLAPKAAPDAWGLIGDVRHDTTSDHAPHDFPGLGLQVVTAADFPRSGDCHPRQVLDSIRQSRDPRVKYAISEGQMFSSYPAHGYPAWTWRPYQPGGSNPDLHFDHGHLSVVGDARADDTRLWAIAATGDDDLDPTAKRQLENLYDGLFYGGTSMGVPVDKVNAGSHGNSLIDLLQHIRAAVDALVAAQNKQGTDK